ncbi:MAG: DUF3300 domain-containing protein [Methylacidiphilales bacterium]|nr:DUF3300 domain-containing protein [Candidatus Methylacidiphilales bacterium]
MLKQLRISLSLITMIGLMTAPLPLMAQSTEPTLSDEQLDSLLAPIALYPDPLLAQILPASTAPGDVVMAARYVAAKKDPDQIDAQPWEESVKALARYPEVLQMMDEKLDWTTELGQAFIAQPDDVFNSVQRLRAKAQAAGNLKDTPQQVIVVEKEIITIMPADPQIIYVPQYSPQVVYVQQPATVVAPVITFGVGFAMGFWIHNELNWYNRNIYYHNYGWNNHYHGGGNYYGGSNNNINIDNSNNINIGNGNGNGNRPGNGNGNGGSVWKPQTKPKPEQLPAYGGNNGNRPGNGGSGNNSKLPNNGNGRPGNGGSNPANKPAQLPANGNNRPTGNGSQQKPSTQPTRPQTNPGQGNQQKPTTRPTQPSTRPSPTQTPNFSREGTKQRPAGGNQPASGNRSAPGNNGGGGRLQR